MEKRNYTLAENTNFSANSTENNNFPNADIRAKKWFNTPDLLTKSLPQEQQLIPEEQKLKGKFEAEQNNLQKNYDAMRNKITSEYKGKLDKLSQAVNIDRSEVTPQNLRNMQVKLHNLIRNDAWVEKNIDLQVGDKMLWNEKTQSLMINSADGKNKFFICFANETPETRMRNEKLAQMEQNRTNVENQGEKLWDWIVRRGPFPGKQNSCGFSVGELLNQFGFRKILPQSGRDGKNWDSILENNASAYFTKIPVNHPNDAPAGSIVVFNENAQLGTPIRKRMGHVEIKGSNGMFYSYYSSVNAAGSSRTRESDPEKYKKLTGFTGYAYVYNGKTPPR